MTRFCNCTNWRDRWTGNAGFNDADFEKRMRDVGFVTGHQAAIFLKEKLVNPSNDPEVFVLDDVIDHMIDEDTFDTLADNVFDEQIKTILFE